MSSTEKRKTIEIRDRTWFDNAVLKMILRAFYKCVFKLLGWLVTPSPPEGAGITIAAPHTSNWDIFYAFGAAVIHDIKIYFSIKESWCRVPLLGAVILYMGAIPIDRSRDASGQVEKIRRFVERNKQARVFFLFTPEGTRSKVDRWKTGFYRVAESTGLPIFLAKVDYEKKESGVFHSFQLTEDMERDISVIQSSYACVRARHPAQQFPAFNGPIPKLSAVEQRVIKAMYGVKDLKTRAEIVAKSHLEALSSEVLEFLVEKGILEVSPDNVSGRGYVYRLTLAGDGFALHMQTC